MTIRRVWVLIGALTLMLLAGCGDDDADSADQSTPSDEQAADQPDEPTDDDSEDSAPSDDSEEATASGDASATFTLGDETWALDQLRCGFGEEETGIEGAEINLSARSESLSLYLAVEPGNNYLEWTDLDDMDGYSWLSVDDPDVTISGRSVTATASLSNAGETQQGTLQADCS